MNMANTISGATHHVGIKQNSLSHLVFVHFFSVAKKTNQKNARETIPAHKAGIRTHYFAFPALL
jgi:hypothetical protein